MEGKRSGEKKRGGKIERGKKGVGGTPDSLRDKLSFFKLAWKKYVFSNVI